MRKLENGSREDELNCVDRIDCGLWCCSREGFSRGFCREEEKNYRRCTQ